MATQPSIWNILIIWKKYSVHKLLSLLFCERLRNNSEQQIFQINSNFIFNLPHIGIKVPRWNGKSTYVTGYTSELEETYATTTLEIQQSAWLSGASNSRVGVIVI